MWGSLKIFRGIGWVSNLVYYSSTACSAPPPPTLRREVGLPFSPGQVRHQKQRGSVKAYISIIYVDSQCVFRVLGTNSTGVDAFPGITSSRSTGFYILSGCLNFRPVVFLLEAVLYIVAFDSSWSNCYVSISCIFDHSWSDSLVSISSIFWL